MSTSPLKLAMGFRKENKSKDSWETIKTMENMVHFHAGTWINNNNYNLPQ